MGISGIYRLIFPEGAKSLNGISGIYLSASNDLDHGMGIWSDLTDERGILMYHNARKYKGRLVFILMYKRFLYV